MANTVKRSTAQNSKAFPIAITLIAIVLIAIVVLTVVTSKDSAETADKFQYSTNVSVTPSNVDSKLGDASLPADGETKEDGSDAAVGKIVPTIEAEDFNDKKVTIAPGTKPYVLAFLAHWCPHCRKEVPKIVALQESGQLPDNVEFIAVATGTSDAQVNYPPSTWLADEDWPWRKITDTTDYAIAGAFGLQSYPYLVFVNADGTVAARMSGEHPDADYISAANLIAESKPASSTTSSSAPANP